MGLRSLGALFGLFWAATVAAGPFGLPIGGGDSGEGGTLDLGGLIDSASKAFGEVEPEEERRIGHEAAAVLLGAVPPVDEPAVQAYVNRVGRWVALQTERPDIDWQFGVLDTDDVNAFAAPGGYVFITKGLLLRLRNEAELAGVLAHECAHVLKRHHLAAVKEKARLDLALTAAGTAADEEDRQALARVSGGFKELYARGLDKEDEYQADRMGVVIAARAGYDPFGLVGSLQTLAAMGPEDGALAFMFKTHPAPTARLERLDTTFPALEGYADRPRAAGRFREAVAGLRPDTE